MTKKHPWTGRFALFLFLPVGILPFVYSSDQQSRLQRALPNDPSGPAGPTARIPLEQRSPKITDWTTSHVVFPQNGFARDLEVLRREPRAAMRWREVEQRQARSRIASWANPTNSDLRSLFFRAPITRSRFPIRQSPEPLHTDWNIGLGAGSTAPGMFPAKYQFNTSATADCTNDFMVFPVNVGSTNGQPNIVAFNNLYSGSTGTIIVTNNGLCVGRTTPGGHTDTKSSPTVYWSYNIHAINPGGTGGAVATSPSLSLDGTKVAFVETATGNAAHFHVLAWKATDGQSMSLQTVTGGKEITSFTGSAPAAGSGSVTDLQLGAAITGTDSNSSSYIDYSNDTAYVGNDIGVLYRIKNVFCTTPACGTAPPSLDTTWGSGGSVTVCSGVLSGPVQDFPSSNVYVGCSDGKLYGFNSVGTPLPNSPVAIGDGSATGDVADAPVVDPGNGLVYEVSASGAGANSGKGVLVQLQRDLSSPVVATIGKNVGFSLHAPTFNDAYFTSIVSSSWILYAQAYDTTGANLTFWGATFNASRVMNSTVPNTWNYGTRLGEGTPLTEFKSGTTDWLFHAEVITPSNMGENNINAFPTVNPTLANTGTPGGCTGITGMIVDNSSASAQAASVYFTCTGSNVAYKFTQNGLN